MAKPSTVDADQLAFLDVLNKRAAHITTYTSAVDLRKASDASCLPIKSTEALRSIVNTTIPGPVGGSDVPIRIYTPQCQDQQLPILMYFHGGCWFFNNLDTFDPWLRRLANLGKFIIVSVDYRLAPEHQFPAGLEDCYAATTWVAEHAEEYGGIKGRLSVCGESAGGNLAAAVSMLAKERGGPLLSSQVLLYPMTDHYLSGRPSIERYAKGHYFDDWVNVWAWDFYGCCDAPHGTKDAPHYHAAVMRAPKEAITGLPPAHVVLAECDIVYDEGKAYAAKLREAGNDVTVVDYKGCLHDFMGLAVLAELADMSIAQGPPATQALADSIRKGFGLC